MFLELVVRLLQRAAIEEVRAESSIFQDVLLDSETKSLSQLNVVDPSPLV